MQAVLLEEHACVSGSFFVQPKVIRVLHDFVKGVRGKYVFFFSRVFLVLVVTNMLNELQMGVLSNADQAYVP